MIRAAVVGVPPLRACGTVADGLARREPAVKAAGEWSVVGARVAGRRCVGLRFPEWQGQESMR